MFPCGKNSQLWGSHWTLIYCQLTQLLIQDLRNKRRKKLKHLGKRPFLPPRLPPLRSRPLLPLPGLRSPSFGRTSPSAPPARRGGGRCVRWQRLLVSFFPRPSLPHLSFGFYGPRSLRDLPSVQSSVCLHMHLHVSSCVPLCASSHAASCPLRRLVCDSHFVTRWVTAVVCEAGWNRLWPARGSSRPPPTQVTPAAALPLLPSTGPQVGTSCVGVGGVFPMA